MSIYVPQMRQRDTRAYNQNTAKSFLDGVRMQRDYEHQKAVQNNMVEAQQRALEASGRADRQLEMVEEQIESGKERKKELADLTQGIVQYDMDRSIAKGAVNERLEDNTSWWNKPDDKKYTFFAPDVNDPEGKRKFFQDVSGRELAEAEARRAGINVDPVIDRELLKNIKDPSMLGLVSEIIKGSKDSGNYLYDMYLNQGGF